MPIWVEIFKLGIQNFCQREHPLMMSDLRGDGGGYEIIPNDWTLEGKNRTLGREGVKKDPKNRTSFMDVPQY